MSNQNRNFIGHLAAWITWPRFIFSVQPGQKLEGVSQFTFRVNYVWIHTWNYLIPTTRAIKNSERISSIPYKSPCQPLSLLSFWQCLAPTQSPAFVSEEKMCSLTGSC